MFSAILLHANLFHDPRLGGGWFLKLCSGGWKNAQVRSWELDKKQIFFVNLGSSYGLMSFDNLAHSPTVTSAVMSMMLRHHK